jgi:hypothetical protein
MCQRDGTDRRGIEDGVLVKKDEKSGKQTKERCSEEKSENNVDRRGLIKRKTILLKHQLLLLSGPE